MAIFDVSRKRINKNLEEELPQGKSVALKHELLEGEGDSFIRVVDFLGQRH